MINNCYLVTGANGFVGSALVKQLDEVSTTVKRVVRKNDGTNYLDENIIEIGSINSKTDWRNALIDVDVVLHTAARVHVMSNESETQLKEYREVNTLGVLNLANQAFESGVKRFIFISSIKVNGESTLIGAPFSSNDVRRPEDFYGQSKAEAEVKLLELAQNTGLEVVIIRPPLVYGDGVKANFASLLRLVNKGVPLPFASISNNKRSLISITNLVDLIICCIKHPKAINQVFLASDDNDLSTREIILNMYKAMGKTNRMFPVPIFLYRLAGKLFRKERVFERLVGSLQVDISKTKDLLDWTPPQHIDDAFKGAVTFLNKRDK